MTLPHGAAGLSPPERRLLWLCLFFFRRRCTARRSTLSSSGPLGTAAVRGVLRTLTGRCFTTVRLTVWRCRTATSAGTGGVVTPTPAAVTTPVLTPWRPLRRVSRCCSTPAPAGGGLGPFGFLRTTVTLSSVLSAALAGLLWRLSGVTRTVTPRCRPGCCGPCSPRRRVPLRRPGAFTAPLLLLRPVLRPASALPVAALRLRGLSVTAGFGDRPCTSGTVSGPVYGMKAAVCEGRLPRTDIGSRHWGAGHSPLKGDCCVCFDCF